MGNQQFCRNCSQRFSLEDDVCPHCRVNVSGRGPDPSNAAGVTHSYLRTIIWLLLAPFLIYGVYACSTSMVASAAQRDKDQLALDRKRFEFNQLLGATLAQREAKRRRDQSGSTTSTAAGL